MKNGVKITRRFLGILLIGGLLTACSKDGDIGPQGETGPEGDVGPEGPQGQPGTANVIYSEWIDTEFSDPINATGAGFDIEAADITQEILDQGTILVFGRNLTIFGFDYFALPFITSGD